MTALMDRRKSVLAANAIYGATVKLLTQVMEPFGVETNFVDICDLDAVQAAIEEHKPGCILMETISNPLLRVGQIDKIAEMADRRRRGVHCGQYIRDAAAGSAAGTRRAHVGP